MATATYVSANSFTVVSDKTLEFVNGRRLRLDCQGDGIKFAGVVSSSYSSPNTTVIIDESTLTSNLSDVLYGVVSPGDIGSLPNHYHTTSEGDGGYLPPASGTTFIDHVDTPSSYNDGKYLISTSNSIDFTSVLSGTELYIDGSATITEDVRASAYDSLSPLILKVNQQEVISSTSSSSGITVSGSVSSPKFSSLDNLSRVDFTTEYKEAIGTILVAAQPPFTDYGAGFAINNTKFEFVATSSGNESHEVYEGDDVEGCAYSILNAINTHPDTNSVVSGTISVFSPGLWLITVTAKQPGMFGNAITFVDNSYITDTDAIIFDWDEVSTVPPWSTNYGHLGAKQRGSNPGYMELYSIGNTTPIATVTESGIVCDKFYTFDGTADEPGHTFLTDPRTGIFRDYLFGCLGITFEGFHMVSFNSQGLLLSVDGSETQPSFNFAGSIKSDGDTGIFKKGDDEFGFTAGGSEVLGLGLDYCRIPDDTYFMVGNTNDYGFGFIFSSATSDNYILTNYTTTVYDPITSKTLAVFNPDSSIDLYYNNVQKFNTTVNGVSVSGTIDVNSVQKFNHNLSSSDHSYSGDIMNEQVGESVVFGDLLYYNFSNTDYRKSSAGLSTTVPGVALSLETQTPNNDCKLLVKGTVRDDSWNWSEGLIYTDTISGTLTQTTVSGVGNYIQIVGRALSSDTMFFDPQLIFEEVV
jgi:hypothetical protein